MTWSARAHLTSEGGRLGWKLVWWAWCSTPARSTEWAWLARVPSWGRAGRPGRLDRIDRTVTKVTRVCMLGLGGQHWRSEHTSGYLYQTRPLSAPSHTPQNM